MQRESEDGGIIISCDFCLTDWDPYDTAQLQPMIEGHRGSVICLPCVQLALEHLAAREGSFECTLCRKEQLPASLERWQGKNAHAWACRDCISQAAGAFSKDPDIAWKRPVKRKD